MKGGAGILLGVTVGEDAVIAAGSVVTQDVAPLVRRLRQSRERGQEEGVEGVIPIYHFDK